MAAAGRVSNGVLSIASPFARVASLVLRPVAAGARTAKSRWCFFPEGMIRVQGTGQDILELCDGQRTVQEIVATLSEKLRRG